MGAYRVDAADETQGREFLTGWADDHGLPDAEILVEAGGIGDVLGRIGDDYSLVIVGATDRGLLSRIIRGSRVIDAEETLETPVLLAERPSARSIRERLFG